jgi:hypothetical protein
VDNECPSVVSNDGPILNQFCKEKEKCMNSHKYVFLIQIVIRVLREFMEWALSSYTLMLALLVLLIVILKR